MAKLPFGLIGGVLFALGIGMFIYGQWRSIIQYGSNWTDRSYIVMLVALCCFAAAAIARLRL
jgi:hypothetical protein